LPDIDTVTKQGQTGIAGATVQSLSRVRGGGSPESDIEYCYAFKTARLVDVQVHGYMLIIYASIRSFPV
jgi:hypothetical protein